MQIEIRLVCPDPNCKKGPMLDPESLNPDAKHSYRYLFAEPDRLTSWVGTGTYTVTRILIRNTRTGMYGTCTVFRIRVQFVSYVN
jgi:hypothetical protein